MGDRPTPELLEGNGGVTFPYKGCERKNRTDAKDKRNSKSGLTGGNRGVTFPYEGCSTNGPLLYSLDAKETVDSGLTGGSGGVTFPDEGCSATAPLLYSLDAKECFDSRSRIINWGVGGVTFPDADSPPLLGRSRAVFGDFTT